MCSGSHLGGGRPLIGLLLVGLVLTGVVGCGTSNPFDQVKVTGTVFYEDGSLIPAEQIRVVFESQEKPKDKKTHPRPGGADVDVQTGEFNRTTTLKYGDGLILGKHKVRVQIIEQGRQMDVEVTPNEVEVSSSSTKFDFKIKKK
jgi:hypothetical protein